ncbi:MAG: asparagine synthase (glutamine-hydrolyzing) [Verrucomicrobia bacterium]|nr:asparagine synthase (glutamine-hydrolyzing) [Verrucomicrobiota bacterium]
MCGIASVFAYHSSASAVDPQELRRIRDHMVARGPDGSGEWYSPDHRVGLAHRRLAIIDLSESGAQPMLGEDGRFVISFNGEIYNYRELRQELEHNGHSFKSQSDTEVLLHLYAEKGEAMVRDLRGMYAFAIWDVRRCALFLARDPFGIKPLYFADDGKTFRAASQVKALLAGNCVDTAPEPAGHVGFFLWGHVPDPWTFYRGIRALPAGHTLCVDSRGVKQSCFSRVTSILAAAEKAADKQAEQDRLIVLRYAMRDTVRHHLVADVPVGVFLSSGLDSTTLAALAAEEGGQLRTVTLGFAEYKGTPMDETRLAEQVAKHYGATHQTIWVTRSDFTSHDDRLFAAMDQPSIDGVNTYFVSLAARRASLKVALSGLGGDELFGGYPSFKQVPRLASTLCFFNRLPLFGRAVRVLSGPVLKRFTSPKYASLLEYGGTCSGAYLLRRGMFMPWELPELMDGEMVRRGWQELQPLVHLGETLEGLRLPRLQVTALESCWYMRNQLLRDSDWASMAHSLEIRTPLVDLSLWRSVAPLVIGRNPVTKQTMARTSVKPLPPQVLHRRKTGFSIPVREWLTGGKVALGARERGFRPWAREVYSRYCNN